MVQQLALNPSLVERMREQVEASLMRSYTKGRMQARRAVEAATKALDVTSNDKSPDG